MIPGKTVCQIQTPTRSQTGYQEPQGKRCEKPLPTLSTTELDSWLNLLMQQEIVRTIERKKTIDLNGKPITRQASSS
jgi:hypothetical protein